MALSLAVGTKPLDGLFTINSNPFKMETFENMLVTWVPQPIARFLLDGMHYHGVLNMAFLLASQRLLQVIEHFDGDEYVSWCHFNATCNVDLMAALFVAHTTHIHVMKRFLPCPTTPWLLLRFYLQYPYLLIVWFYTFISWNQIISLWGGEIKLLQHILIACKIG
ncbi:hypothetical protein COP2_047435 [Malus domestica]